MGIVALLDVNSVVVNLKGKYGFTVFDHTVRNQDKTGKLISPA